MGTTATIVPLVIAAFPFIARLAETSLREVNPNSIEMAQSLGASPWQIITKVMIPAYARRAHVRLMQVMHDLAAYNESSDLHTVLNPVGANPKSGATAVAVAVLSIVEPDKSTSYADIARALAADYYNIYVVDLDSDRFIEYSSQVGGEELAVERHGTDFFASARRDTMVRIYEADREPFLTWFSKENIQRELDAQGVFTTTYRLIDTGTPMYVTMKITRMPGGNRIIIGISIVDAQMKQSEQLSGQ